MGDALMWPGLAQLFKCPPTQQCSHTRNHSAAGCVVTA